MKFFVVPILIILIATQAFSKWVILFEFKQNQEYITQALCENKAKPNLKCEGRCQLKILLEKENGDHNSSTIPTSKLKFTEVLFSFMPTLVLSHGIFDFFRDHHTKDKNWKYFTPPCRVFRPPLA